MSSFLYNHSFYMYNRPAAGCASMIIGLEFTINRCIQGHHILKNFGHQKRRVVLLTRGRQSKWRVCSPVKTDAGLVAGHLPRKIGNLLSVSVSDWYNRPKLAHDPVKFSARSISHFAMNIIIAKTFPNVTISAIRQNIFPPKFPAIQYKSVTYYESLKGHSI